MAKTMLNNKTNEVKRVSNSEAKKMFKSGNWKYIPKYEGKRLIENKKEYPFPEPIIKIKKNKKEYPFPEPINPIKKRKERNN
jgi:hypothetical protein